MLTPDERTTKYLLILHALDDVQAQLAARRRRFYNRAGRRLTSPYAVIEAALNKQLANGHIAARQSGKEISNAPLHPQRLPAQ